MRRLIREFIKKVPVIGRAFVQREELRAIIQKLWETPGHFYSPIPDISEIRRNEEKIFAFPSRTIAGVDLNEAAQVQLFDQLTVFYADHPFSPAKREGSRYFFENNAFSYFDALVFQGFIRHVRPRRVIEIGSGFSSCALLDVNERFFDHSIACTFIEPYPQLLTSLMDRNDWARATLIASKVQEVNRDLFLQLAANDILFIDSSHVVKTNSDVNYVFFEVLPHLRNGVYIHFHDIFYPFEYPKAWVYQGRAWNEAYLLRAFLQANRHYRIELFNSFMEMFYRDQIARRMPLALRYAKQSMIPTSAQSIWLKKCVH